MKNKGLSRQSGTKAERVVVAMSGGVDSSVAAVLLKKEGYEVVGAFIKVWEAPKEWAGVTGVCNWREERRWAMRAAAKLEIPLITFDLSEEYKKGVVDYMVSEYRAGRTPNPDVMCNKEIKFGAFWRAAEKKLKADFIATGHYAITKDGKLHKAKDKTKEQSYFLWAIEPELLPKIMFPIGNLKKTEVRKLAKKFDLPNDVKPDSQGLCFIGKVDFKDFLKNFITEKPGKALNDKGETIGEHPGALFFTLGERHGFTITKQSPSEARHYVIAKDLAKNTITVSNKKQAKSHDLKTLTLIHTNWLITPKPNKIYKAQIRYHGTEYPCQLEQNGDVWQAIFTKSPDFATPGQSLVLYDKKVCLGGGVIA